MKAPGYSLQRPRPKNLNSASVEEAQALNPAEVVAEIAATHPGVPVEMFCIDEHCIGLKPALRSVWPSRAAADRRSGTITSNAATWLPSWA